LGVNLDGTHSPIGAFPSMVMLYRQGTFAVLVVEARVPYHVREFRLSFLHESCVADLRTVVFPESYNPAHASHSCR